MIILFLRDLMSFTVNTVCNYIQMSITSDDACIRHLKEILKKYMEDMFQAMATAFLSSIQDHFKRMEDIYLKLRTQKEEIYQQKQTLMNIQSSINRLSAGFQALATQMASQSSKDVNSQYFHLPTQKSNDLRPKSSISRNTNKLEIQAMKYISKNTGKQVQIQSNQLNFLKNLRKIAIRNKQNQNQDPLISRKLL